MYFISVKSPRNNPKQPNQLATVGHPMPWGDALNSQLTTMTRPCDLNCVIRREKLWGGVYSQEKSKLYSFPLISFQL